MSLEDKAICKDARDGDWGDAGCREAEGEGKDRNGPGGRDRPAHGPMASHGLHGLQFSSKFMLDIQRGRLQKLHCIFQNMRCMFQKLRRNLQKLRCILLIGISTTGVK